MRRTLDDPFLDILLKCVVQTVTVIRAPNSPTDWKVAVKPSEVNALCEKFPRWFSSGGFDGWPNESGGIGCAVDRR